MTVSETELEASLWAGDAGTGVGGLLLGYASAMAPGLDAAEAAPIENLLWSLVAGRELLAWSLLALLQVPQVDEVVLLVEPGREAAGVALVETLGDYRTRVVVSSSPDSAVEVPHGLNRLSAGCRLVVVLQGNRPLVTPGTMIRGIEVATAHDGSAAVAYLPVRETIKETEEDVVVATLPREELALLQSPQVFPRVPLSLAYQAYRRSDRSDRSDMSNMSRSAGAVDPVVVACAAGMRLVPFLGDAADILITSRQDLQVAEAFLGDRMS